MSLPERTRTCCDVQQSVAGMGQLAAMYGRMTVGAVVGGNDRGRAVKLLRGVDCVQMI